MVFNQGGKDNPRLIWVILKKVQDIQQCNARLRSLKCGRKEEMIVWTFPREDWIKCNLMGHVKMAIPILVAAGSLEMRRVLG